MKIQNVFKRYEVKYILTRKQYLELRTLMTDYMKGDEFGRSTICNLYYDTPDFLLIRRSLEKPLYKEKLRLRSYGVATKDSTTFAEIKKKMKGIVYKRRISLKEPVAMSFLSGGPDPLDNQISHEISYFLKRYPNLQPRVFLSYNREAFYGIEDDNFRMTFDDNILWRDYDLSLTKGVYGHSILQNGEVLAEIKTIGAFPLWLVHFLSKNQIRKVSFSKYGRTYQQIYKSMKEEGKRYA